MRAIEKVRTAFADLESREPENLNDGSNLRLEANACVAMDVEPALRRPLNPGSSTDCRRDAGNIDENL